MATATFVKELHNFTGHAELFKCDPPMEMFDWDNNITGKAEYVVASATHAMFSGPETYIFAADAEGNVTDWGELRGSFQGACDIDSALDGAGYEVVRETPAANQRQA